MKKWTKAERERASREGKARWAARKLRDTRSTDPTMTFAIRNDALESNQPVRFVADTASNDPKYFVAVDVVRLIAHDVPADVIVKVVERILRP